MSKKADVSYVREDGTVIGVRYQFADGVTVDVRLADLPYIVRAEAMAYGVKEALRDTYAEEKDPAKARGLLEKRLATMLAGQYATRGGGAVDWVELIMAAALRIEPTMAPDVQAARKAKLDGLDDVQAWLKEPARKGLRAMVDLIRKERAAERAKAAAPATTGDIW